MELGKLDMIVPFKAIICYKYSEQFYLETRKITLTDNGYEMQNGTPMRESDLRSIIKSLNISKKSIISDGILPSNLIYWKDDNLIWKHNSDKEFLYHKDKITFPHKLYFLPKILFHLKGNILYIHAYKDDVLSGNTELYQIPFANVHSDGKICMGNVALKIHGTLNDIIEQNTKKFFRSTFTSDLSDNERNEVRKLAFLNQVDKYDDNYLIPTKLKLRNIYG